MLFKFMKKAQKIKKEYPGAEYLYGFVRPKTEEIYQLFNLNKLILNC